MHWRPIREADLATCLEIQPACLGDQIVGRRTALGVWRTLLDAPAFLANVIEADPPVAGHHIVACGMGVFVARSFADREMENPQPGLNSRILAAVAGGKPVVLTRPQIADGNAGAGLDFVNLYGTWREGTMNDAQLAEVQALLGTSFVEHFAGYRFNRVLKEAVGDPAITLARATGTYRVLAEFEAAGSALVAVTPESVASAPYSVAARMYRYQNPVLRLRPAEQSLLVAALGGRTDAELSTDLGLSVQAIKKRWVSVFQRVAEFKSGLLSQSADNGSGRGPQQRHRVLAYIRTHPEELRPFTWD